MNVLIILGFLTVIVGGIIGCYLDVYVVRKENHVGFYFLGFFFGVLTMLLVSIGFIINK